MTITFEPADASRDRAVLMQLNVEYLDWLDVNIRHDYRIDLNRLLGRPIPEYVAATLDGLCAPSPPEGVFYLVHRKGRVVGMGGLRRTSDGASEMKRVFVRPSQRGGGVGSAIVKRLISDAESFGYTCMRLDSAPFQISAHRLYQAEGFRDRTPYDDVEIPGELHHNWRFMERGLPMADGTSAPRAC
jgi:putative acetyltransferase